MNTLEFFPIKTFPVSSYESKKLGQRSRFDTIKHHTWPMIPMIYGKVTTSQLDITNESQEVIPFPADDHKASINRRARKHNKNKTEIA